MCAFLKTVGVVSDHPAGSFDDALRRTVILCKLDHHSFRKIFLKIQHDLRLCAAKTIDGLVIITDDKQIVSRLCQKFDRLILDRIDILKFIDQNIAKLLLPFFQNIRPFYEQVSAQQQHIIKINFPLFVPFSFVFSVYLPESFLPADRRLIFFNIQPVVFHDPDLRNNFFQEIFLFKFINLFSVDDLKQHLPFFFL